MLCRMALSRLPSLPTCPGHAGSRRASFPKPLDAERWSITPRVPAVRSSLFHGSTFFRIVTSSAAPIGRWPITTTLGCCKPEFGSWKWRKLRRDRVQTVVWIADFHRLTRRLRKGLLVSGGTWRILSDPAREPQWPLGCNGRTGLNVSGVLSGMRCYASNAKRKHVGAVRPPTCSAWEPIPSVEPRDGRSA